MKKEIADKWVKELRSGKYKQAREQLKKEYPKGSELNKDCTTGFCCLGVLTNMFMEENPEYKWVDVSLLGTVAGDTEIKMVDGGLPKIVREWAGIKSIDGAFYYDDESADDLANLNDTGKTFEEIAVIIEDNMEEL